MKNKKTICHGVYIQDNKIQIDIYYNGIQQRKILDKSIYSYKDSTGKIVFDLEKIESWMNGLYL